MTKNLQDTEWCPSADEIFMMQLVVDVGGTYDDFYMLRYGSHIRDCITRVSSMLLRHGNGMTLLSKDKSVFERSVKLVSAKLKKILEPRFKKGDLVIAPAINGDEIMTVISDEPFLHKVHTKSVHFCKKQIMIQLYSSSLGLVNCDVDNAKLACKKSMIKNLVDSSC
jgi:hypothetical protein